MNIKKILGIFICLVTIITVYTFSEHNKVYAFYCNVDQLTTTNTKDSADYSVYFLNTVSECNPAGYIVRIQDVLEKTITEQQIPNPYDVLKYTSTGEPIVKAYDAGGGWIIVPLVYTDNITKETKIAGWNYTNSFNPKSF